MKVNEEDFSNVQKAKEQLDELVDTLRELTNSDDAGLADEFSNMIEYLVDPLQFRVNQKELVMSFWLGR